MEVRLAGVVLRFAKLVAASTAVLAVHELLPSACVLYAGHEYDMSGVFATAPRDAPGPGPLALCPSPGLLPAARHSVLLASCS